MPGWKEVSAWLYRVSSGWVTLATLLIFMLFSVVVLPGQAADAREKSHGAGSPDTSFWYSACDLYRMADAHRAAGRAAYVRARWTFDLAFPVVYGAFLATATSWVLARSVPVGRTWRIANVAPVLAVILDYLENASTSLVMARYPAYTPVIDRLAGMLTAAKWMFIVGSIVILLSGCVFAVWRWWAARGSLRA